MAATGGSVGKKRHVNKKRSSPGPTQTAMPSVSPPPPSRRSLYRRVHVISLIMLVITVLALLSISSSMWVLIGSRSDRTVEIHSIDVVNEFPHDPNAFTQGLLYAGNDTLFESTGLNGESSVRKVALRTGKVEALHRMAESDFGEGLTLLGKRLYQVIWLKQTGFVYDAINLKKLNKFTHQMKDGWGLATDGNVLFGSDGTSTLYHIDPQTGRVIKKHTVKYKMHEVHNLNELEYINGEIWANVWMSDCIARICPENGSLIGWILLPELRKGLTKPGIRIDCLNGIAWDSEKKRIFVTGKWWPKLFEIKLKPSKKLSDETIEQMCLTRPNNFAKP